MRRLKRATRKVFAKSNVASWVALGSPASRMLASFGLGLDRPHDGISLQVFDNEASALQWLIDQEDRARGITDDADGDMS